MQDYLISVAQKWGLFKYVRFNSEVKAATWNETTQQWNIDVSVIGGKAAEYGEQYTISSDFLTCAIGQLNRPRYPNIEGVDTFAGKIMHSARWDWNYDLRGKRVGIIGTGEDHEYVFVQSKTIDNQDVLTCAYRGNGRPDHA